MFDKVSAWLHCALMDRMQSENFFAQEKTEGILFEFMIMDAFRQMSIFFVRVSTLCCPGVFVPAGYSHPDSNPDNSHQKHPQ